MEKTSKQIAMPALVVCYTISSGVQGSFLPLKLGYVFIVAVG